MARIAIRESFVITLQTLLQNAPAFFIHLLNLLLGHNLKSGDTEEGLNGGLLILSLILLIEFLHDFVWRLVRDSILLIVLDLLGSDFRNDARLCS